VSQPRSLQRLLAGGGEALERLLERAQLLADLNRRLRRHLPPALADHVSVANVRDGVLVLQTSSAEWRTRVHFLAPRLIEALRAESAVPSVTEIRIRVRPAAVQQAIVRGPGPKLSPSAARAIESTARSVGDDALRRSLARLAKRHSRAKPVYPTGTGWT
jgi:hypothetical protein